MNTFDVRAVARWGSGLGAAVPFTRALAWPTVWLLIAMLVTSIGTAGAAGPATPAASQAASPEATPAGEAIRVPVLAYYYIWFEPSSWSRAKSDLPLLGRYSSDDPAVMRQHVRWAKAAGIDGFIVSWKDTEILSRRLKQLVQIAHEEDFQLVIIYQGLDFDRQPLPVERVAADLDYFIDRYAGDPAFTLFPRPVVIWSGTWEFSRDEIAYVTDSRRDRLLILASERNPDLYAVIADLVDGDAYYWSSVNPATYPNYAEKLAAMASAIHTGGGLWIAPAAPGFDARMIGGERIVDRLDGATLQTEFATALGSSPDAIGLISWNEFSENSHLEPSCNYGAHYLTVLAGIAGSTAAPVQAPQADVGLCEAVALNLLTATPVALSSPMPSPNAADFQEASDFDSSSPGGSSVRPQGLAVLGVLSIFLVATLTVIVQRTRGQAADGRTGVRH